MEKKRSKEDYKITDHLLGRGFSGYVYEATENDTGRKVAIKKVALCF